MMMIMMSCVDWQEFWRAPTCPEIFEILRSLFQLERFWLSWPAASSSWCLSFSTEALHRRTYYETSNHLGAFRCPECCCVLLSTDHFLNLKNWQSLPKSRFHLYSPRWVATKYNYIKRVQRFDRKKWLQTASARLVNNTNSLLISLRY